MFKVLVVEDDAALRQMFCRVLCLTTAMNRWKHTESATDALELMDHEFFDIIITDVMMPGMDGFEFVKTLRESGYTLPILVITAKDQFADKQTGFSVGVDDYMVKPIDVNEMVLRVSALLRRARSVSERRLTLGGAVLEFDTLTVETNGKKTTLPQKEFLLLYKLASYPGRIFTRQQIMDDIWGLDSSHTEPHTVDVHINRLRDRFRNNPDFEIITVRGPGYKVTKREDEK